MSCRQNLCTLSWMRRQLPGLARLIRARQATAHHTSRELAAWLVLRTPGGRCSLRSTACCPAQCIGPERHSGGRTPRSTAGRFGSDGLRWRSSRAYAKPSSERNRHPVKGGLMAQGCCGSSTAALQPASSWQPGQESGSRLPWSGGSHLG